MNWPKISSGIQCENYSRFFPKTSSGILFERSSGNLSVDFLWNSPKILCQFFWKFQREFFGKFVWETFRKHLRENFQHIFLVEFHIVIPRLFSELPPEFSSKKKSSDNFLGDFKNSSGSFPYNFSKKYSGNSWWRSLRIIGEELFWKFLWEIFQKHLWDILVEFHIKNLLNFYIFKTSSGGFSRKSFMNIFFQGLLRVFFFWEVAPTIV